MTHNTGKGGQVAECLTGARYLAKSLHDYGVTDVFFMEAILRHTLLELEKLGVRRVLAVELGGAAPLHCGGHAGVHHQRIASPPLGGGAAAKFRVGDPRGWKGFSPGAIH